MPVVSMPIMNVSRALLGRFIMRPNFFKRADSFAHDKDEFGQWRPVCNRFGVEYLAAYHSYVQISAPEEDYDGRLDLYKL